MIGSPSLLYVSVWESLSTLTLQLLTYSFFHSNSFWQHQHFQSVLDARSYNKTIIYIQMNKSCPLLLGNWFKFFIIIFNGYLFTVCTFYTVWRGLRRIGSTIKCRCRLVDKRIFTLFDFSILWNRKEIDPSYIIVNEKRTHISINIFKQLLKQFPRD